MRAIWQWWSLSKTDRNSCSTLGIIIPFMSSRACIRSSRVMIATPWWSIYLQFLNGNQVLETETFQPEVQQWQTDVKRGQEVDIDCHATTCTVNPGCLLELPQSVKTRQIGCSKWSWMGPSDDSCSERRRCSAASNGNVNTDARDIYHETSFAINPHFKSPNLNCRHFADGSRYVGDRIEGRNSIDDLDRLTGIFDYRCFPIARDCLSPEQIAWYIP